MATVGCGTLMKLSLLLLTFVALTFGATAGVTTQTITFSSKALDQQTTYIAVLPSPLEPGRKYPVLYLLHGADGSYWNWNERTSVTQMLEGRDLIVIMPDGGEKSWYLDSPLIKESKYDSLISHDLVEEVDSRFPTFANRNGRGIAGLSMGGHGALSLAAKHPDIYSAASSLSGILDITPHAENWGLKDLLGKQPQALDEWQKHSVFFLAETFTTASVALLFDTGVADSTGAVSGARRLHKLLDALKVQHIYREYPGTHNWAYWNEHVDEHLDFHMENLSKPE